MKEDNFIFIEDIFNSSFTVDHCQFLMEQEGFIVQCKSGDLNENGDVGFLGLLFTSDPESEHAFIGFKVWAEDVSEEQVVITTKEIDPEQRGQLDWSEMPDYFKLRIQEIVAQADIQKSLKIEIASTHLDGSGPLPH